MEKKSTRPSSTRELRAFKLPPKNTFPGFVLRISAFFGLPYALLHVVPMEPLLDAIAAIESAMLNALGVASVRFGAVLSSNAAWFQIVPDCSGLVMVFLLLGLLWSTPVRRPLRHFLVFAPLLLAWNLVRLFLVLYAGGIYGQTAVEALHVGLWFVDAGIVLGIWWKAFSKAR